MDAPWQHLSDELGPAKIVLIREPASSLQGIVVVDNVACGPAIGGIRMAPDITVEEVARLARAMTLKNAAAGLAHGGGKGGIVADPGMDGGVICAAVEYHGGTQAQAFAVIGEKIRENTRAVLERARADRLLPRAAAVDLARARVSEAQQYRQHR